jgi:RimJ/RimL family protein N-acetyltransferase
MSDLPTIRTDRLELGWFDQDDAAELERLAGAPEVADTTLTIPHPYQREDAERFLAWQRESAKQGHELVFALHQLADGRLVGCASLREIDREHLQAELGYWIGVPYWNQGFATEAARALVQLGFEQLGLNRIYAHHMARNRPSGRVLERIGMRCEGVLRQRVRKWGKFEDVVLYAILREDLTAASSNQSTRSDVA